MRALFSVVSMLIVLGVMALAVMHQLRAARPLVGASTSASSTSGALAGAGGGQGVREAPGQVQRDVQAALQQGSALRASQAEAAEGGSDKP